MTEVPDSSEPGNTSASLLQELPFYASMLSLAVDGFADGTLLMSTTQSAAAAAAARPH